MAYVVLALGYVLLSEFLFSKTEYAVYLYVFMALSFVFRLSESKRNDFLKSIFNRANYLKVRLIENILCSLPFLAFLVYQKSFLMTAILAGLSLIMALFNFGFKAGLTIPTPFGKKPFEFTEGFRNTLLFFPAAYFIVFLSISEENVNLGIFSMISICLICISYYSKPEEDYFVWNFSLSPKQFLVQKLKTACIYFTFLSLPVAIVLASFFFEHLLIIGAIFALSYLYLITVVLAKYAAYPNEMNPAQGIIIAISFLFPPILIGIIPFFYGQSVEKLSSLLND